MIRCTLEKNTLSGGGICSVNYKVDLLSGQASTQNQVCPLPMEMALPSLSCCPWKEEYPHTSPSLYPLTLQGPQALPTVSAFWGYPCNNLWMNSDFLCPGLAPPLLPVTHRSRNITYKRQNLHGLFGNSCLQQGHNDKLWALPGARASVQFYKIWYLPRRCKR